MQNVFVKWLITVAITLILGNFVGWLNVREFKKKGYISSSKKETEKKMPKDNIMKVNEQAYVIPQDIVSKIEITINKDIICIKIK